MNIINFIYPVKSGFAGAKQFHGVNLMNLFIFDILA